ncbi:MAG: LptA/OstA family protein [Alphaproteobacteria bacterium]|uniref:LptA/OstA family protein n=1 Tax=Candidatus Nitrobium versatile TaxID=2884831 RepID=A0A953J908_9BACT|nr:LptA/OstA family protein [Candidatus Nitrobium versatile]
MKNKSEHGTRRAGSGAYVFIIGVLLAHCLLIAGASFAAEKNAAKTPTVITSQSLTADNKARTALFEGSVVAKKGDMTLFADTMLVHYSDEKGSGTIKKIDAEGNVKLVKGDRIVTAKFATYFAEPEEHAVFTGDPKATEGENVVTGSKMIYYLSNDRSVVQNSRVFLVNKEKQK